MAEARTAAAAAEARTLKLAWRKKLARRKKLLTSA
ncbi:hypothetical protein ACP4OV_018806 [Aristida adscensionis]